MSPNHTDFRPEFNTTHAISDIVATVESMSNNHYTGLIFLVLDKDFDSLNHNL